MHTETRKPTLADYKALWILKLAKIRRREFGVDSENYEKFYEDYFEERDVSAYIDDRRMALRREVINDTLRKNLPRGGRLLDVGCGLGDVMHGIPAEDGYQMFGFDFAASNVKVASRRLAGKAEIKQGSIYEIPFESASMDAAMCLEVLEHIEHDDKAVKEIARVLKPGGFLIAAVPYYYWWPEYERLMGHFRHYTRESFGSLLRSAGLEPEQHLPNFPNWHKHYTLAYPWVRIKHMTAGKLLGSRDLYHFKWPWSSMTTMDKLLARLKPIEDADRRLDYSKLDTSTTILARKKA
ncbi:MAG: class I SAM-dependent methyltransferase [Planctomycetota bacterium]|nr:class I SAM-dependent methyltransferase [Planctomycetota bacterium]